MKIIYIHQYFNTPQTGGSLRSYYLAKALIEKGFEVEMITSWNKKKYEKINIEGITVHYLPVFYENDLGFFSRVIAFLKFIIKAFFTAKKIKNATICYATSTPITVGVIALALKFWCKIPYYFEVRDLWPLAPIEMGYIKNKWLIYFLFKLEKIICKNSEKVIVLSPGMADWVNQYQFKNLVILIPNMADCDFFELSDCGLQVENTSRKFTITYFGTLGDANHLEYFLDAAAYFQKNKIENIDFLIVGKGKRMVFLKEIAAEKQLRNLHFLPHSDKFKIREILQNTAAIYISFANYAVLETTSPNKFFDGISAGKLIITNTKGWIKDLIEENECGFYTDPESPADFLTKISYYFLDKENLKTAQVNARKLAETQFERKLLSEKFVSVFNQN